MDNLLLNGSFEGDTHEYMDIPELKCPESWVPWWHVTDTRPEYNLATRAHDPRRVKEGQNAAHWFTTFGTHTAGLAQPVKDVVPGAQYRLSAWVQCWSYTKENTDPAHSDGRYRMRIGVDPYGGQDPESSDVVWSPVVQPYDLYHEVECYFVAKSDRCTVFVWGQAEWPVKGNDAYVDALALYKVAGTPGPDPSPPPANPDPPLTARQLLALIQAMAVMCTGVAELAKNGLSPIDLGQDGVITMVGLKARLDRIETVLLAYGNGQVTAEEAINLSLAALALDCLDGRSSV